MRIILVFGKLEESMLYKLGRFLQLVPLLLLPIAMVGELRESIGQGQMLMWAGVGVGVFLIGRMLQQAGGKSE